MYRIVRGQFDCSYCDKAIALMQDTNTTHSVEKKDMADLIMFQKEVGYYTVPIIFKDDDLIGGYAELEEILSEA